VLSLLLPVLFALLLWWFGTGAILYLDGLGRGTYRRTLIGATAVLVASLVGLIALRQETGTAAAYLGFLCGIGIWSFVELTFLTGFITGPVREPCPARLGGWARFGHCAGMVMHHELAILLAGAAVAAFSVGAENSVALATFLVLWGMRLSSKLNLYLGVANAPVGFLPDHLAYLASAFTTRRGNALFPLSVGAGLLVVWMFASRALVEHASAFAATEAVLLATITLLAVIEHLFFMLPIDSERLWQWAKLAPRASADMSSRPAGRFLVTPQLKLSQPSPVGSAGAKVKE